MALDVAALGAAFHAFGAAPSIAVGVAGPSASGQVITTTVIANSTASDAGRSLNSRHAGSACDGIGHVLADDLVAVGGHAWGLFQDHLSPSGISAGDGLHTVGPR